MSKELKVPLLAELLNEEEKINNNNSILPNENNFGTYEPLEPFKTLSNDSPLLFQITLSIDGMTCATCRKAIEKAVIALSGISSIVVSLLTNSGIISYDIDNISLDDIIEEIEDIGFDANLLSIKPLKNKLNNNISQVIINLDNICDVNDINNIKNILINLNGIISFDISLNNKLLILKYYNNKINNANIILDYIKKENYVCNIKSIIVNNNDEEWDNMLLRSVSTMSKFLTKNDIINDIKLQKYLILYECNFEINNSSQNINNKLIKSYLVKVPGIISIEFENENVLKITFNKYHLLAISISNILKNELKLELNNINIKQLYPELDDVKFENQVKNDSDKSDKVNPIISFTVENKILTNDKINDIRNKVLKKYKLLVKHITFNNTVTPNRIKIEYIDNKKLKYNIRNVYKYIKNDLNYDIIPIDSLEEERHNFYKAQLEELNNLKNKLIMSCVFAVPAFIISMILSEISYFKHYLMDANIIPSRPNVTLMGILLFLLCTPIQLFIGSSFYKSCFNACRHKTSNMSTLIAIGTLTAWSYGTLSLFISLVFIKNSDNDYFSGGEHFFETGSTIITIVFLGKYLQLKAKFKTTDAISLLMNLQENCCTLVNINDNGEIINEEKISTELIVVSDIIKIERGSRIPLDGTIIYGSTSIDNSMITGESIPVLCKIGDKVLSSSINCGNNVIYIRVNKLKYNSILSQIINLMKESQLNKPSQQEFADTVSSYFVPVVVTIALFTFILWYSLALSESIPKKWYNKNHQLFFSLLFSMSVLVIACPCALGLATPTAIMVGIGVGSNYGLLIKGGNVLEISHNVDTIVFDKTGTLTKGTPSVTDFIIFKKDEKRNEEKHEEIDFDVETKNNYSIEEESFTYNKLLKLIGSSEINSEHPLAKAIVEYVKNNILDINDITTPDIFKVYPGKGIYAKVDNYNVIIGNYEWLFNSANNNNSEIIINDNFVNVNNLKLPNNYTKSKLLNIIKSYALKGKIPLLYVINNKLHGLIVLFDEPRKDAKLVISYLKSKNINIKMLTGDNHITAYSIADYLGIDTKDVISQVLPQDKHNVIKSLQLGIKWTSAKTTTNNNNKNNNLNYKYKVCMIGDGINDAAALSQSDLGISIGNGQDIAIEAADVILMNNNLHNILVLLDLSKTVIYRIYLNFLWALGFNCLGIPLAAGILYPSFKIRLPPEFAALAMGCSSLCVLSSSLLLKKYKSPILNYKNKINNKINNKNIELVDLNKNKNVKLLIHESDN